MGRNRRSAKTAGGDKSTPQMLLDRGVLPIRLQGNPVWLPGSTLAESPQAPVTDGRALTPPARLMNGLGRSFGTHPAPSRQRADSQCNCFHEVPEDLGVFQDRHLPQSRAMGEHAPLVIPILKALHQKLEWHWMG